MEITNILLAMSIELNRRSVLKKSAVTTVLGAGTLGATGSVSANNYYTLTVSNTGEWVDNVEFFVERGDCGSGAFKRVDGAVINFEPQDDGVLVDGQLLGGEETVFELECYEYPTNENNGDDISMTIES
ncbi:twin-arginine translocation signal domain-containing protein [Natrialba aegyptia]|uniref:twin-arginine translocation signal domain-containing protein n=1 Tax=Natrialba aegyptia TaxID=129789 RepID=UPI001268710B|nr:twin-arginine translocation signal domain-containing protein [Natrialba aegyptia]